MGRSRSPRGKWTPRQGRRVQGVAPRVGRVELIRQRCEQPESLPSTGVVRARRLVGGGGLLPDGIIMVRPLPGPGLGRCPGARSVCRIIAPGNYEPVDLRAGGPGQGQFVAIPVSMPIIWGLCIPVCIEVEKNYYDYFEIGADSPEMPPRPRLRFGHDAPEHRPRPGGAVRLGVPRRPRQALPAGHGGPLRGLGQDGQARATPARRRWSARGGDPPGRGAPKAYSVPEHVLVRANSFRRGLIDGGGQQARRRPRIEDLGPDFRRCFDLGIAAWCPSCGWGEPGCPPGRPRTDPTCPAGCAVFEPRPRRA